MKIALLAVLMIAAARVPAGAQLLAAKDGPISYGHHHLNVTSQDAHRRFWVDALGGTAVTVGTVPSLVVRFPNVFIFMNQRPPAGGTKGTSVNHVGFETRDIRAAVDRLKAAGFPMVTRAELPADYEVINDLGQRPGGNIVAFVMGPDETKVELIENRSLAHSVAMHHVHFATKDVPGMQAWYAKVFGAIPGTRAGFQAADLPGVNLTFSASPDPIVPTRGRSIDHIGFEVRNLEEFCRQLESSGVKLDRGVTRAPAYGTTIAFLTDPSGTNIELTEGLNVLP